MQSQNRLYLCVRWGHAESEWGANGEDTHLLVRAATHEAAAAIADEALRGMPTHLPGADRGVQPYCQLVIELGFDTSAESGPGLVLPRWFAFVHGPLTATYPSWTRGEMPGEFTWRPSRDVYGAADPTS